MKAFTIISTIALVFIAGLMAWQGIVKPSHAAFMRQRYEDCVAGNYQTLDSADCKAATRFVWGLE